jgi:cytochrome P450
MTALPLPPGRAGLPFLGETLPFLSDGYGFVASHNAEHGAVFRMRLLGKDAAVISGPEASKLWIDGDAIQRGDAMPPHIVELFGGQSLPFLDGPTHVRRKEAVMEAFRPDAIASYLPAMQSTIERALGEYADTGAPVIACRDFKVLALELIGATMASVGRGERLTRIVDAFQVLTAGLTALPLSLPFTRYGKAVAAKDAILVELRAIVAEHRKSPNDDGLSRMLAWRGPDGHGLDNAAATLELHHFNLGGYGVFNMFIALMQRLTESPDVLEAATREVREHADGGAITHGQLARMTELGHLVKEVRRVTPMVPAFFGVAKRDLEIGGYRIPAGWTVLWSLWGTNQHAASFPEPARFDPARFARGADRGDEITYVPQGAGGDLKHRCAGADYTVVLMQTFATLLLRSYRFTPVDATPDRRWDLIPAEPKNGFPVRITRKSR